MTPKNNLRIKKIYLLSTIVLSLFFQFDYIFTQAHSCGIHDELEKYQTLYPE